MTPLKRLMFGSASMLFLSTLFIATTGFAPRATKAQASDQCVRDCAANSEAYHQYVEQLKTGSCQACAHCAAAALYQCTIDTCELTDERRKEYSDKKDTEISAAKALGTVCRVK
jgi:hypothetical protein